MADPKSAFAADLAGLKAPKHRFQLREGTPTGPIKGDTVNGETTWYQVGKDTPGPGPMKDSLAQDPNYQMFLRLRDFKNSGLKFNKKNLNRAGITLPPKEAKSVYAQGLEKEKNNQWGGQQVQPAWLGGSSANATDFAGIAKDQMLASGLPGQVAQFQQLAGPDGRISKKEWKQAGGAPAGWTSDRGAANRLLENWTGQSPAGQSFQSPLAPLAPAPANLNNPFQQPMAQIQPYPPPGGLPSPIMGGMPSPIGQQAGMPPLIGGKLPMPQPPPPNPYQQAQQFQQAVQPQSAGYQPTQDYLMQLYNKPLGGGSY